MSEIAAAISALGNIIVGCAAVAGSIAAFTGLGTWRRERNSDCARRLAAVAYQHQNALLAVLIPWPTLEEKERFELSEHAQVTAQVFRSRWLKSYLARIEVENVIAEADLRWSDKASLSFKDVKDLEHRLILKIDEFARVEHRLIELEAKRDSRGEFAKSILDERSDLFDQETCLRPDLEDTFIEGKGFRGEINDAFEPLKALLRKNL